MIQYNDYFPFGMTMAPRSGMAANEGYRYGFNGMEGDQEFKGSGSSYDFGARIYDPRVGRWLSVDPFEGAFSMISPYVFKGNNPIFYIEIDGKYFVNPFKAKYDQKSSNLHCATEALVQFNTQNEGIKGRDIRSQRRILKRNLKEAKRQYNEIASKYNLVEDLIYTLMVSDPEEYDYFQNLEDHFGNEVPIVVQVKGANTEGKNEAETDGLATFNDPAVPGIKHPTFSTTKGGIIIMLYLKGVDNNDDAEFQVTGHNYKSFSNELGDIRFFFNTVKDGNSLNHFNETSQNDSPRYYEVGGAGYESDKYEQERIKSRDNYAKENNLFPDSSTGTFSRNQ